MNSKLLINFLEKAPPVYPGAALVFGRSADIVIDDNRYLHRHLGKFVYYDDIWWLQNLGSAITITVVSEDTDSSVSVGPGDQIPLSFARANVRFKAGAASYELHVFVEGAATGAEVDIGEIADPVETVSFGDVPLTEDQKLLLVALCEPRLLDPRAAEALPTNRELADRLGWSAKKFTRKLDNVCDKLRRAGVPHLHGGGAGSAYDRRRALIAHVLANQLVDRDDLALLDHE